MLSNKLVVYTAVFGSYDDLKDPIQKFEGCDFVCFTDQKDITSSIWDIRYVDSVELTPALHNRYYKMFPHKIFADYKYSLYVDANISILSNPIDLIDKYLSKDIFFACPRHFERDCIYDEAEECIRLGRAFKSDVISLINRYNEEGFPKHFGLAENNILLRCHDTSQLDDLMSDWWECINNGPMRDQLSLMYLCWKKSVLVSFMKESSRNKNKYFLIRLHHNNDGVIRNIKKLIKLRKERYMLIRFFYLAYKKIIQNN